MTGYLETDPASRGACAGRRGSSRHPVIPCRALVAAVGIALLVSACAKRPPADFAPDPGLIARIDSLRIETPLAACPGERFPADYIAVLDDGGELPFATKYDKDHPPALHVVFLSRSSREATALENGDWAASPDPLASAMTGFRLRALVRTRPDLIAQRMVLPEYDCLDHELEFVGPRGRRGRSGGPGPSVTVRIALLSSPFVARLIVAEVTVEEAPSIYVLADADRVPSSDWLRVAAVGGRGGNGQDGEDGRAGRAGTSGCPGTRGEPGAAGGDGQLGGDGGPGGHVTIIAAEEEPFLAGLVDARTPGGPGGHGGDAGNGGAGGAGGAAVGDLRRCEAGAKGPDGADGRAGEDGRRGQLGSRPQVITVPTMSVFGARPPQELVALLTYHEGARR